jgi:hypothetical protein
VYFGLGLAAAGTGMCFWRKFKVVDDDATKVAGAQEYELTARASADDDVYYSGDEVVASGSRLV